MVAFTGRLRSQQGGITKAHARRRSMPPHQSCELLENRAALLNLAQEPQQHGPCGVAGCGQLPSDVFFDGAIGLELCKSQSNAPKDSPNPMVMAQPPLRFSSPGAATRSQ